MVDRLFVSSPDLFTLLVGILATWRISALLCYDYSFEWLRQRAQVDFTGPDGMPVTKLGRILSCFWCTSLHVGIVVVVLSVVLRWTLLPFAVSGGAILLQHWTRIDRRVQEG